MMVAEVVCHPPLGATTTLPGDTTEVPFTVLLRFENPNPQQYDVAIWHNFEGSGKWSPTLLKQDAVSPPRSSIFTRERSHSWIRFVGSVPRSHSPDRPLSFTVRYQKACPQKEPEDLDAEWERVSVTSAEGHPDGSPDQEWQWVNAQFSLENGHLLFAPSLQDPWPTGFDDYFLGRSKHVSAKPLRPSTSKPALVWKTSCTLGPCPSHEPVRGSFSLGRPRDTTRWFSLVRLSPPWLIPSKGKGRFEIDKDSLFVSFERTDGKHIVIVPMSGISGATTIIQSGKDGSVELTARNDDSYQAAVVSLVAVADTFEIASAAAIFAARALTYRRNTAEGVLCDPGPIELEIPTIFSPDVAEREELQWYDSLTYCTWNSLGNELTEQKILSALDSLRDHGISVSHLIVDDNWQDLNRDGRLLHFEANKHAFPGGLKAGLAKIRDRHPNIKDVSMWHTMIGYWNGLSPDGSIASKYKTRWVNRSKPPPKDWTSVDENQEIEGWLVWSQDSVFEAYSDYYAFLASCGVTSVKTDFQCSLDYLRYPTERRDLIRAFQAAWLDAVERHLGGRGIACMAMAPVLMFDSQLNAGHRPIPVRSSDDYFPDIATSHSWHVWVNAHNATLVSLLNAVPDWDMFQTQHEWGEFHAVGRAISGGPVTITDKPGQHETSLIRRLSAVSRSGRSCALRPSGKGVSTTVYNGYKDPTLLRVRNYVTGPSLLVLLVAFFNLGVGETGCRRISEIVTLEDLVGPSADTEQKWIIRGSHTGQIFGPVSLGQKGDSRTEVVVSLAARETEILSCYAVFSSGSLSVATLGLAGKYIGAAAISAVQYDSGNKPGHLRVKVKIRGGFLGEFAFWIDKLDQMEWKEHILVEVDDQPVKLEVVTVGREDRNVLEVDVGRVVCDPTFLPSREDVCNITLSIRAR